MDGGKTALRWDGQRENRLAWDAGLEVFEGDGDVGKTCLIMDAVLYFFD